MAMAMDEQQGRRLATNGAASSHLVCLVPGCGTDLRHHKRYFQHRRICQDHHGASSILINDVETRFCQQCGSLHPLSRFEGSHHSCRESLSRRSARRKGENRVSLNMQTAIPGNFMLCELCLAQSTQLGQLGHLPLLHQRIMLVLLLYGVAAPVDAEWQ